ncbi:Fungal-trans multi-domain protein [Pyrenophora teres f. maculata]|nr:Fungal-trans multi-domain protein [Pyrenophora teres f. maculata]
MQSFTFAPPTLAPRENQRNYVFVDEHNRHKRLKVMRACEGCRRRKIKCDAATTNAWPCAACIRLKLNCVPPTVSYDKDYNGTQTFDLEPKPLDYSSDGSPQHDYQRHQSMAQGMSHQMPPSMPTSTQGMYQSSPYVDQQSQDSCHYQPMSQPQVVQQTMGYAPQQPYSQPSLPTPAIMTPPESEPHWRSDSVSSLSEALGELKIDHTAIAPYITNMKKTLAETPAQEEYEVVLPQSVSLDHTVRIPPEMMPSDDQALHYFEYFFANVHPYCPVINKAYFYQQWHSAPDSISPLMLESIFACSTLMLGDIEEGNKWLALATKHEESFKDVSRLSTMQAMILLLKAREASPKRGYFWRCWMAIVSLIAMAKDLELHEHYDTHQMGKSCGSTPHDCIAKSRVWQMCMIFEVMIGGPQGRYDFGVSSETVDLEMPRHIAGQDPGELQVARQFIQYARIAKNVHHSALIFGKLRKKTPDWALDPAFVGHNTDFSLWLRELPEDMQIVYPQDGSPPWIPSHQIANMHSYHCLAIIMHFRPQVHAVSDSYDGIWKQHMLTCYAAAKNLCKLQEAILKTCGMPGLLCQMRGISFHIYAVLTCTMLHLVAVTCPDPDINHDARDFFVRHVRILETMSPHFPMPEMQQQVNSLRQAFSADCSKPFELKPTFPFGSPQVAPQTSPMSQHGSYRPRHPSHPSPLEQPGQVNYHAHPITPPISASDRGSKADSPVAQSLVMMASGHRGPQPNSSMQLPDNAHWNPQRIFDQWNVAFGTPPPTSASSQSSPPLRPNPSGNDYDLRPAQGGMQTNYQMSNTSPSPSNVHGPPGQMPPSSTYANAAPVYVTPTMWQEAVASSLPDGLKRRWDGNSAMADQSMYKRAR